MKFVTLLLVLSAILNAPLIVTHADEAIPETILIIGASGAIGKSLTKKLLAKGHHVVAGLRRTPLPPSLSSHPLLTESFGVNCQDNDSIDKVFRENPRIGIVWNLAAPLSVETANDPTKAFDVVVNGMERILNAARKYNVGRVLFSDSIGSYGYESPRNVGARWLVENPTQDPGSDYGRQKRLCRNLMRDFVLESPSKRSSRFAVIPGVLHTDPTWGAGTTEYALGEKS